MSLAFKSRLRPRVLSLFACMIAISFGTAAEPAKQHDKPAALPSPVSYTTPPEVSARLQKFLPNAFDKLRARLPLHVIIVGDEIADMAGQGEDAGNQLLAWPTQFIMELASEFAFTGGIRLVQPNPGKPDRLTPGAGPEITVRVIPVRGNVLNKALAAFQAYSSATKTDILLVATSAHNAAQGGDLMDEAESLHGLIESAAAARTDLLLAGPLVNCGDPLVNALASTRTLAGVMRDTAQEAGIAFADLGDLSSIARFNDAQLTSEACFDYVTKQLRSHFTWPSGLQDWQHPLPSFHKQLSAIAYQQLTKGSPAVPWQISATSSAVLDDAKATVTSEIINVSDAPLTITVQPLPLQAWQIDDKPATLQLKARAKQTLTFNYKRDSAADQFKAPPVSSHEPLLRVPVFVASSSTARLEEVRATITPVAILWKLDSLFNQSNTFTIDNVLLNTSGKDIAGLEWSAEWANQKKQGKTDLAAGKSTTIPLMFDLIKAAGTRRIASPLILSVKGPGISQTWVRGLEANQNFGLEQDIPLTSNTKSTAQLRVEATARTASLIFDLASTPLQNDTKGNALKAELHIDARSYGKRLEAGSTEAIIAQVAASDGIGTVQPIAPWAFGNGYGMKFNEQGISAKLSTDRSGHRIFTLTLPRSYLYLHEWALGNGNSQLGIAAKLSTSADTFELSLSGRDRDDAESHVVLELTAKPTSRWTVNVW